MNIFGLDISLSRKSSSTLSIDTLIQRLEAAHDTVAAVNVTPDSAMQSPTVSALVTAISRRIATLPVKVMQSKTSEGRTRKEDLPNHPVAKLLNAPNDWQDRVTFWLDAASWLVRYGNLYCFKSRGLTGPIRQLIPLLPSSVTVEQNPDTLAVSYKVSQANGRQVVYDPSQVLHARTGAQDGILGDSPIMDVREAIALEIAAEKMGASIFANAAMPTMVFQYAQGAQGHKTDEERSKFVQEYQDVYAKRGRFKSFFLPKGVELSQSVPIDNEKAQFLATRQYQRTVIAGAFGVPPHLVGDLSSGTFNNVEQERLEFVGNVVLPYVRIFEAALERALLTDEDRRSGVIIRFNVDGALRGDFKTRQEGLNIQRQAGVISPNDWREAENMNPISEEDGGETYWMQGPSGQNQEQPPASTGEEEPDETEETEEETSE